MPKRKETHDFTCTIRTFHIFPSTFKFRFGLSRTGNTNSINYQYLRLLKSFKSRNKLPLKKRFHYYSVLYRRSEFLYLRIGSTENWRTVGEFYQNIGCQCYHCYIHLSLSHTLFSLPKCTEKNFSTFSTF